MAKENVTKFFEALEKDEALGKTLLILCKADDGHAKERLSDFLRIAVDYGKHKLTYIRPDAVRHIARAPEDDAVAKIWIHDASFPVPHRSKGTSAYGAAASMYFGLP